MRRAHATCITHALARQLLALTFLTTAKRIVVLGWCVAPGETAEAYNALLQWVLGMGGTVMKQQQDGSMMAHEWSVHSVMAAADFVILSDWAEAVKSSLRRLLPQARHL